MISNESEPLDADSFPNTVDQAREYIVGVMDNLAEAPALFAHELKAGKRRVFFYAASAFDWQPLHRFTHLCDTFVFVDPRKTEAEFMAARQQLVDQVTKAVDRLVAVSKGLHPQAAYEVVAEVTGEIAEMRNEPWMRIPDLEDRRAWGAVQRLERHVGGQSRDRWLVFVAGSPLVVYDKLFIQTGTAPECLALLPPILNAAPAQVEAIHDDWAHFAGWNGELGQLIRHNHAPLPRLAVLDEPMDWPTQDAMYSIPHWRGRRKTYISPLSTDPWPDLAPAPGAGQRRIVLTRRPINPHVARSVGAVVLSYESHRQYRWPDGVLVIFSAPPVHVEQTIPDGPGVVNLNIAGRPLHQSLAQVEAVCVAHGITKVAIQGLPGFEDEAADLVQWRQQEGQIKELVLHVECDGHFLGFASAADVID